MDLTTMLRTGCLAMAIPLASCASASAARDTDVEALQLALEDEYRAEAMYEAVIEDFGEVRPFINIIEAERRHAMRAKA